MLSDDTQYVDNLPRAIKGKVRDVKSLLTKKDDRNVREKYQEDLELNHLMDRNVEDLSGGELQRFATTMVLIQSADVYMFDEPSSYLDVKQRLKAARAIRSVCSDDT